MGLAEKVWLALLGLTLLGAWFAETGHAGWGLTLAVFVLITLKGHLVIDHYMELRTAHPRYRRALHVFLLIAGFLTLLSHGANDAIRRLTTLG